MFCQMRRALDLVHYIARESVTEAAQKWGQDGERMVVGIPLENFGADFGAGVGVGKGAVAETITKSIRQFEESVAIVKASPVSEGYKEQLESCLGGIVERVQDFTDSAYTSHEHRQGILLQTDRAKVELFHLLRSMDSHQLHHSDDVNGKMEGASAALPSQQQGVEQAIRSLVKATNELTEELRQTAIDNAASLELNCQAGGDRLMVLQECALMGDDERLKAQASRFTSEHLDYAEDVAKLLHQAAVGECEQIRAQHAQINLRIYGPQVGVAAVTLCLDPHSKPARSNLENFCAMWKHLMEDVLLIAQVLRLEAAKDKDPLLLRCLANPVITKQPPTPGSQSVSFPPPHLEVPLQYQLSVSQSDSSLGKLHNSVPNLSAVSEDYLIPQVAQSGQFLDPHHHVIEPRRHSTSGVVSEQCPPRYAEMDAFGTSTPTGVLGSYGGAFHNGEFVSPEDLLNSFRNVENNEIINRAKKMVRQAGDMFDFTSNSSDKVRTTQDLFNVAELFAEEANLLYKVIRLFSYDVPAGEDKRSFMAIADNIPKHCHQMRLLIQSSTVGKASTFKKVDSIVREARQIVFLIARVVQICYANAHKYNLDFINVSAATAQSKGALGSMAEEAFGGSGSAAARRASSAAAGGSKRTKVSFLLGGY